MPKKIKNVHEYTVKPFLFAGHLISYLSWVGQSMNLRSQIVHFTFMVYTSKSTNSSVYEHVHRH